MPRKKNVTPEVIKRPLEDFSTPAYDYPFDRDTQYEKWKASRFSYMSSSAVPHILGLSSYTTPLKQYEKYINKDSSFFENDAMILGSCLEDGIQKAAERQSRGNYLIDPLNKTYISRNHAQITATPDGVVRDLTGKRKTLGLNETKCSQRDIDLILDGIVPPWLLVQVQVQLGVLEMDWALVTVYHGQPKVATIEVDFCEHTFNLLVAASKDFLQRVQDKNPPTANENDADILKDLVTTRPNDTIIKASKDVKNLVKQLQEAEAEYRTAFEAVKPAEAAKKAIQNQLLQVIGGAGKVEVDKSTLLTINRVDVKESVKAASHHYRVAVKNKKDKKADVS